MLFPEGKMRGISRGAVLLLILIGSARAGYHLVRIVVLAGIGLAGMYMLHKLAQDYQKIQGNRPSSGAAKVAAAGGRALLRAIFKRSVVEVSCSVSYFVPQFVTQHRAPNLSSHCSHAAPARKGLIRN